MSKLWLHHQRSYIRIFDIIDIWGISDHYLVFPYESNWGVPLKLTSCAATSRWIRHFASRTDQPSSHWWLEKDVSSGQWFGHIQRMNSQHIPRRVYFWNALHGRWRPGRPKTSWRDTIQTSYRRISSKWIWFGQWKRQKSLQRIAEFGSSNHVTHVRQQVQECPILSSSSTVVKKYKRKT